MTWHLKEETRQILQREKGTIIKPLGSALPIALIYPNHYRVGMSNLGFQVIYSQLNKRHDIACERFFLPEARTKQELVRTSTPIFSLENQRPLSDFCMIGVAMSFELDYINLLTILELGRIPLLAAERKEEHPIVVIGGPCATFNPEPLADFVDACVIGEGEEVILKIADIVVEWQQGKMSRNEAIVKLANVPGVYVPSLYTIEYETAYVVSRIQPSQDVPKHVLRQWVSNLDAYPAQTVIMTPDTEFENMYLIEVTRGCGRHCRFCMAGYCFRNPRARSLDSVLRTVEQAEQITKRIGLVGAAISDYPEIERLSDSLMKKGIKTSVASLRADSLSDSLVKLLVQSGQQTITLAPEAGSEKLRKIINKGITNQDLYRAVDLASRNGIPHVKLYIMIGLPYEEEQDLIAIAELAMGIKKMIGDNRGRTLTLSINPFIPKPFTPFQRLPMDSVDNLERKLKLIKSILKRDKGITVISESPKWSYIQAILSRGNRNLGKVIADAHSRGGNSSAWRKAFSQHGLDADQYVYRTRSEAEVLPWEHINIGFRQDYLREEAERAIEQKITPRCQVGECHRCGIC